MQKDSLISGFTRREFMKLGIATAGCFTLSGPFEVLLAAADVEELSTGISSVSGKYYKAIPTTCGMCEAGCGIVAFTEGNRVVAVQGNPLHPNNKGKICAKGVAGINYLYDPERLLFPMKRVGQRGEGKWKRITWNEAYEEVIERVRKSADRDFVLEAGPGAASALSRWLCELLGISILIDNTGWQKANRDTAHELTWGEREGIYDVSASRYILNFGANPFENDAAYISLAQRIVEARVENRAKLVTFDVRLSNTAGRSDEWFPINPATDAVVALAMARVILKRGLADREFLDTWTTASFAQLDEYLNPYDVKRAEAISGIKASDIERIAVELATTKPSTIISGGGVTSHSNGVRNERCMLLLNAVAGTIDAPGGYCVSRTYPLEALTANLSRKKEGFEVYSDLGSFLSSGREMGVYLTLGANPVYASPVGNDNLRTLLKNESVVPYLVAVDTHMSETALMADIVLPAATYLESWGLESRPSFEMVPCLSLTQPVSEPLGEALPFSEICLRLANGVGSGGQAALPFQGMEDVVKKVVSQIKELADVGGMDYLVRRGVWIDAQQKPAYASYKHQGFKTPSGKFEIYSDRLQRMGEDPLPAYQPVSEIDRLTGNEFILIRYQVNVHAPKSANAKWLHEIVHDNPLWLNTGVAQRMNINDGDLVLVSSKAGALRSTVRLTQGIHPKVVALAAEVGHWGCGHIARAKKFNSDDPDTALLWWEHDGNGSNVNSLVPLALDPIGKGQAWMDTEVTISKA